ncbi:MAG TPA: type I-C CRISPR-associated protein Cas5c [Caulobacteraceae bacterium]|nr:type I-C CRISPR-associated protein Cas5c [Caulobacteraceae bacterium]
MTQGVVLHVWGERACFTRPEMKVERVSYDVITPSAARGILEAVHWKPAFAWRVERLRVLEPITFETIRRNEVASRIPGLNVRKAMNAGSTEGLALYVDEDRQQRAATILKDVAYVIEARIELRNPGDAEEPIGKHLDIFNRRARKGQCFHRPCLGTREFAAEFALIEGEPPTPHESLLGERDLGWMALDIDFARGNRPMFFRAKMRDGVIEVPLPDSAAVRT